MAIDLAPSMAAPWPIKLHVATVLPAFAIGAYPIFVSAKGALLYRALSFLHLFIPLTIYGGVPAIVGAGTHNVHLHRYAMVSPYSGGFCVAGAPLSGQDACCMRSSSLNQHVPEGSPSATQLPLNPIAPLEQEPGQRETAPKASGQ